MSIKLLRVIYTLAILTPLALAIRYSNDMPFAIVCICDALGWIAVWYLIEIMYKKTTTKS